MLDLEKLENQISEGRTIEEILGKYDWKTFEKTIADIFKENGFLVKQNFRFKTKQRYEIDVVAVKSNQIICADCKWWGKGRYKKTGLKNAIGLQEERVKEFKKFLKKNVIAQKLLKLNPKFLVRPLLLTLHDEDILMENETFVIPAWKINQFLVEPECYF